MEFNLADSVAESARKANAKVTKIVVGAVAVILLFQAISLFFLRRPGYHILIRQKIRRSEGCHQIDPPE